MGDTSGIFHILLLSYVRRGLCGPLFFFYGVRCAQYKVHAQCSFAALAPHMPCMLLVYYWASEASPTWAIHLGFFIYYYILSYVRRGLCDPPFFFLRRALCAVQSSCTVLFRCARPTHALHASSYYRSVSCVYKKTPPVCMHFVLYM